MASSDAQPLSKKSGMLIRILALLPRHWLQKALAHQWKTSLDPDEKAWVEHFTAVTGVSPDPIVEMGKIHL